MYKFNRAIICPEDPSADEKRIKEYEGYYKIKYDICERIKPKKIVEIGVRAGYSAWTFLQAMPDSKYIGIDANNGTHGGAGGEDGKFHEWSKKILKDYDVEFILTDTQSETKLGITEVDLFHVDGDHTFEGAMHDMNLAKDTLSENGYILVDDIDYVPSVKEAVNQWLEDNPSYEGEYMESLRGEMLISKKK